MHTVGSPQSVLQAGMISVPFDTFSLSNKFEWIMNESKTNFELYIKMAYFVTAESCMKCKKLPCI